MLANIAQRSSPEKSCGDRSGLGIGPAKARNVSDGLLAAFPIASGPRPVYPDSYLHAAVPSREPCTGSGPLLRYS